MAGKYTLSKEPDTYPEEEAIHLIHHGRDYITKAGTVTLSHSEYNPPSWHNYAGSDDEEWMPSGASRHHDFYERRADYGTSTDKRQARPGADRQLFTNRGGEGDPRETHLDYLNMDRKHVGALPTMLGAAQFAAHERGNTLVPSKDLSPHSAKMVGKLTGKEQAVTNSLTFMPSQFQHNDDYGRARAEQDWGAPMSQRDYTQRRQAGRDTIKALRGRSSHFHDGVQGTLF